MPPTLTRRCNFRSLENNFNSNPVFHSPWNAGVFFSQYLNKYPNKWPQVPLGKGWGNHYHAHLLWYYGILPSGDLASSSINAFWVWKLILVWKLSKGLVIGMTRLIILDWFLLIVLNEQYYSQWAQFCDNISYCQSWPTEDNHCFTS